MVLNDCLQNDIVIFVYYEDFREESIQLANASMQRNIIFDKHKMKCPIWPWSNFVLIAVIFDMIHCC